MNFSRAKALMDFRHSYIAHNLDLPDPSGDGEGSVEKLKYGDETFVLDATVSVGALATSLLDGLSVWLRETRRPESEQSPITLDHEADRAGRLVGDADVGAWRGERVLAPEVAGE